MWTVAKHYDSTFKSLAEEDPRGLLFLFADIPLTEEVTIEPLPREVTGPALQVDHVYRVKTGGREWIWHIEVQTHYRSDMPERMLRYAAALALKYPDLEIECTLVILSEKSAPRQVPPRKSLRRGGFFMRLNYRVIEMWREDARKVLATGRASLLPWVTLMRASEEELATALRQIAAAHDSKLAAQSVILGELRYDKDYIAELLGRIGNMIWLTEDVLRESNATRDFILKMEKEATERGLAKGMAEGRVVEARRGIRLLVSRKFPALRDLPDLDQIASAEQLEQLLVQVAMASSDEEAAKALSLAS